MATENKLIPAIQAFPGEYGCDFCNISKFSKFILVNARKGVDYMLCESCKASRDTKRLAQGLPAWEVKAIYNVVSVVPANAPNVPPGKICDNTTFPVADDTSAKTDGDGKAAAATIDLFKPRTKFLLNTGVSLVFELDHVSLKPFTQRQLNDACDAVENSNGFYKFTLLPPLEGGTRFELHAEQDGVEIDLPGLQRKLIEVLEMMA